MKKILALVLALTMLCGVIVAAHADDDKIKIGVSIWSSTDTLGSEVKRLIDAAAEALDVEVLGTTLRGYPEHRPTDSSPLRPRYKGILQESATRIFLTCGTELRSDVHAAALRHRLWRWPERSYHHLPSQHTHRIVYHPLCQPHRLPAHAVGRSGGRICTLHSSVRSFCGTGHLCEYQLPRERDHLDHHRHRTDETKK